MHMQLVVHLSDAFQQYGGKCDGIYNSQPKKKNNI